MSCRSLLFLIQNNYFKNMLLPLNMLYYLIGGLITVSQGAFMRGVLQNGKKND